MSARPPLARRFLQILQPIRTPTLLSLWQTLKRTDKTKVNGWMAARNALGVVLALTAGMAFGNPSAGAAAAVGALNVAYSDGYDPYRQRAFRMIAWSVLGAVAVFTGSVTGAHTWPSLLVAAAWAFVAGIVVSLGTRPGDLGLNTLVTLVVFAARAAFSPRGALEAAALVLAGGLLQTLFSILLWPLERDAPEREAIRRLYTELAANIDKLRDAEDATPVPSVDIPSDLQDTVDALGREHNLEGERMRFLFDQIDRLQLSAFAIYRLIAAWSEEQRDPANRITEDLDRLLHLGSQLLAKVDHSSPDARAQFDAAIEKICDQTGEAAGLADETRLALDTFRIRVHAALRLADPAIANVETLAPHSPHSAKVHIRATLDTLRANLNPRSAIFRHAVRLTVCVTVADAISRGVGWERSYWMPMTVAVILKPDFTTTFSRGILRLTGTFVGLGLATVLYHVFPQKTVAQIVLVAAFTFFLRSLGPANYGVLSVAVSGLIVFLLAVTGVGPRTVVWLRAINTLAGGVLALLAYGAWPTWERKRASDILADFLDACRLYLQAVVERFATDNPWVQTALDRTRTDARRARSNAAASLDRLGGEPATKAEQLTCLNAMLASSSALLRSIMALDAALMNAPGRTPPDPILTLAKDVDPILYYLAAALRHSSAASQTLPSLDEDHRRMIEARAALSGAGPFLATEADHIAVSLSTLREQVLRYVHPSA